MSCLQQAAPGYGINRLKDLTWRPQHWSLLLSLAFSHVCTSVYHFFQIFSSALFPKVFFLFFLKMFSACAEKYGT